MGRAFAIARAHGSWPDEAAFAGLIDLDKGLAGVLAVADLLDEDSVRCDTTTLLSHRHGTTVNMAHWIRHTLTSKRIRVTASNIEVGLVRLKGMENVVFEPLFVVLRNHFKLIHLYGDVLTHVGAQILNIKFDCNQGSPPEEADCDIEWAKIKAFADPKALLFHLMNTFFDEALLDEDRLSKPRVERLLGYQLQKIELSWLKRCRGLFVKRSEYEMAYRALMD